MSADELLDKCLGDLAKRVKGGDAAAFTKIVNLTTQDAYAYALRFLQSRSDAEDAVQEAYLKAWRGIGQWKQDNAFRGWFFSILRHTCLDKVRTNNKKPQVIDDLGNHAAPPESDPLILEEERKRLEEERKMVHDCLSKLSPICQCLLREQFKGTKSEEAAKVCDCKPADAPDIRYKCKRKLKKCLETKLQ